MCLDKKYLETFIYLPYFKNKTEKKIYSSTIVYTKPILKLLSNTFMLKNLFL